MKIDGEGENYFIIKAIKYNILILIVSFFVLIVSVFLLYDSYLIFRMGLLEVIIFVSIFMLLLVFSGIIFSKVCRFYLDFRGEKLSGILCLILSSALLVIFLFFISILVIIPIILSVISLIQLNIENFKYKKKGE